ncbi:unnamed protein product [Euphydryas editha]|uniref:Uncharacterized protein n=1 Tax=Euphydryas editha TaxID=104508 RepID=A0AAU9TRZ2_EUPED|nr:unnamed protein product [Euphydryas editha]
MRSKRKFTHLVVENKIRMKNPNYDPTPKTSSLIPVRWRPSRASNPIALIIDKRLTTGPMWDEDTINFWNATYSQYRRRNYGFKNDSHNVF